MSEIHKTVSMGTLSCTIWKNTNKDNGEEYFTYQLQRSYKDSSNEWKYTNTLRRQDLPTASILLERAFIKTNEREFKPDSKERLKSPEIDVRC